MALEFRPADPRTLEIGLDLCRAVREAGGRAHFVGGCVRDALLDRPSADYDIEVFGLEPRALSSLIAGRWRVDLVGEAFGVIKLRDAPIDVALPRRESKRGLGHRGFEVHSDPHLSVHGAGLRRDFTCNAIAYDPLEQRLIDPLDGKSDLERGILRATSERFLDDPLRVLRGAQLSARFELEADQETLDLCSRVGLEGLPSERIGGEWEKLFLLGRRPSVGLSLLQRCGWLQYFPELEALDGCPQDPEWHPEGDVLVHTGLVLDAFAEERVGDREEDLVVGAACLCHDLGKPRTTVHERGRWRSPGHEQAGVEPTRSLLRRLGFPERWVESVVPLVAHHLKPFQLYDARAGDSAIRRLARRVGRIDRLVRLARADARGRGPRSGERTAECDWLLERARALEVEAGRPRPLIMGRHLVARGLEPGPHFREILDGCYEKQLDGVIVDRESAERYLDEQVLGPERALRLARPAAAGLSVETPATAEEEETADGSHTSNGRSNGDEIATRVRDQALE